MSNETIANPHWSSRSATMNLIQAIKTSSWAGGFKTVSCSRGGCSRWLTQRHLETGKVGVYLRGSWYCSYRCFTSAAEEVFAQMLGGGNHISSSRHNSRMPLGLNMVSKGLLNDAQYREVNEESKQSGEEIGDVVVRRGFADEKQVTAIRAAQWACPVYTAPSRALATHVQIPPTLTKLYTMVPLRQTAATKTLMMGFVQGVEYSPLYAVEQITGYKAQPCFVTPTDYWNQVEAQREANNADELIFDSMQTPEEMTKVVCNYGALLNAAEISIVRCREFLWARAKGGKRTADMLFRAS